MPNISLTRGQSTQVDAADFPNLSQWSWMCSPKGYAVRVERNPKTGRRTFIHMHRQIMNAERDQIVDHINGNRLDNRRANLRIVTRSQNMWNRKKNSNASSPYKGVSAHEKGWRVRIRYNGKRIHLGYFQEAEEAALMYDGAARQLFGTTFAKLNFPERTTPEHLQIRIDTILARHDLDPLG